MEILIAKILKDHITAFVILDGKVMQEKNASMLMNASEIFIYATYHLHLRVENIFARSRKSFFSETFLSNVSMCIKIYDSFIIFKPFQAYPDRTGQIASGINEDRIDPTRVWNPMVDNSAAAFNASLYTRPTEPTKPTYPLNLKIPPISGLFVGAYCKDNLGSYTCPCHTGFIHDDFFESGLVKNYNMEAWDH